MTHRKLILTVFIFITLLFIVLLFLPTITGKAWISDRDVYLFDDLTGPTNSSTLPPRQAAKWQDYSQESKNRLAIFLTDENSAWLGLAHGLKTIGIPFFITREIDVALQNKLVLVYPTISGKTLQPEQFKTIANYARDGGNLIATNVLGGGLEQLFGFESVSSSMTHHHVTLQYNDFITPLVPEQDSSLIRISNPDKNESTFGTNSYINSKHPPLAIYDDGSAAITFNQFEKSRVYAIGFDLGFYLLKAYNRRMENVANSYANGFEPSVDNLLYFLKAIYQQHQPDAVTLGTVPEGKSLSVILSHDIDYSRSLENALVYAKHEHDNNLSGTHFILSLIHI